MTAKKQIRNSTAEFLNLMKSKTLIIVCTLLFTCTLFAADRQTLRDAQERTEGTATMMIHTMEWMEKDEIQDYRT